MRISNQSYSLRLLDENGYAVDFGETASSVRIVTIPMCPDLLRYDQLGEADNLRGRVVRAFFWLMRAWPE